MAETSSNTRISIARLIFVPSVISLAVTLLRLIGELQHWSPVLFNPSAGGGLAIVGIVWLVPIFGIYFALKLSGAGEGPASNGRAIGYTLLGLIVNVAGGFVGFAPQIKFPGQEIVGILLIAAGALIILAAWPALFKTLLAYGYAARIPVAILMLFAIRGHWGTHYDILPPGFPPETGFWSTYLQIAFLPQMIFWIAFTIIIGSLFGSIATAIAHRRRPAAQVAPAS